MEPPISPCLVPGLTIELQLRAEFFNVLNEPNFSPSVVNNDLYSANGAAVTSARYRDLDIISSASIRVENRMVNGCHPSTSFSS
jgi:hypothetical protein